MVDIFFNQYALIREGRQTLFRYCESLQTVHFIQELETFGGRSIQYLMIHMANTYFFWLGHFTSLNQQDLFNAEVLKSMHDIRNVFNETDNLVNSFLEKYGSELNKQIANKVPGRDLTVSSSPLELFTHVITHEYHHKGQILSMSRQLGYIPVDTDLIRFE